MGRRELKVRVGGRLVNLRPDRSLKLAFDVYRAVSTFDRAFHAFIGALCDGSFLAISAKAKGASTIGHYDASRGEVFPRVHQPVHHLRPVHPQERPRLRNLAKPGLLLERRTKVRTGDPELLGTAPGPTVEI
jgi:hypothetical protein